MAKSEAAPPQVAMIKVDFTLPSGVVMNHTQTQLGSLTVISYNLLFDKSKIRTVRDWLLSMSRQIETQIQPQLPKTEVKEIPSITTNGEIVDEQ